MKLDLSEQDMLQLATRLCEENKELDRYSVLIGLKAFKKALVDLSVLNTDITHDNVVSIQRLVFEEIKRVGTTVEDHIAGFVQNDYSKLIKDSFITKENIFKSMSEFNRTMNRQIENLMKLKYSAIAVIKFFFDNYESFTKEVIKDENN